MKPTVDYVRGLRDVLEIPTKEERRHYHNMQNIKIGASVASGLATSAVTSFVLYNSSRNHYDWGAIAIMTLMLSFHVYYTVNFLPLTSQSKIERAGRAHLENIRNNIPVPRGLEREAFD